MTEVEASFEKERTHFANERENMKIMYEKALQSKEETRLAAMKQLEVMNHLIEKSIGGGHEEINHLEHQEEPENDNSDSLAETDAEVAESVSSRLLNARGARE